MCGGQFPLLCCPEGTMFTRFDANKSTKGASKLRRDLINAEIANLRELLPLPPSTRQRLSQLQLMALVCVFVRKANYFQQAFKCHDVGLHQHPTPNIGFSKALSGFLMMMTQNGKLLYISDNAAEYLGHSMEDLLIHGDSVYDIIDKQDHQAIQCELGRPINGTGSSVGVSTAMGGPPDELRLFLCRMNVSRNARRQMRFGDQKVVLVQGRYLSFLPLCSRNEPVFLATCTPVAMPETRECVVQGATNVFTTIHSMDMRFMHIDNNGEHYLGFSRSDLQGVSWYRLLHWDSTREAQTKHRLITQSEQERSCILLAQFQRRAGDWLWLHCVLQVKESSGSTGNSSSAAAVASSSIDSSGTVVSQHAQQQQQPVIVCTNQVLTDAEAAVMRANNWLYHYYSAQNKLQYGLAYDVATPTSSRLLYYPEHHQSLDYPAGGQTEASTYSHLSAIATNTFQAQPHPQPHLVSHHSQPHNHHHHHHHHHSQHHHSSNHNSSTQQLHHVQHTQEQQLQQQQDGNSYLLHHQYQQQQQSTLQHRQVTDSAEPVDYSYSKRKAKELRNLDLVDVEPTETDIVSGGTDDRLGERHNSGHSTGNGTVGLLVMTHSGTNDRPRMLLKVDPSDLMDQWNPSPPWSDTLQKVPDLCHQELSPYINSAPPTPTATPNVMHNSLSSSGGGGGGSSSSVGSVTTSTPSAFNFDWMPEQYVPTMMTSIVGVAATPIPSTTIGTVPVAINGQLSEADVDMDHLHYRPISYWPATSSTASIEECEPQPHPQQHHYYHHHHLHHRLFPLQPPPSKPSRRTDTNNMERESP